MRELESVHLARHIPISQPLLIDIRDATQKDETMQRLQDMVKRGWPENKKDVDPELISYFHVRDEISIGDDLIFRGERVVIPRARRRDMVIARVHDSHIGVNGCLRRARKCLYWPGMSVEIRDCVQKCDICQDQGRDQPKETLQSHDIPERSWAKVGTDLF